MNWIYHRSIVAIRMTAVIWLAPALTARFHTVFMNNPEAGNAG